MHTDKLKLLKGCSVLLLLSFIIRLRRSRLERALHSRPLSCRYTIRRAKKLEKAEESFRKREARIIPLFLRLYAARRL